MKPTAFPLSWPAGRERTPADRRRTSRFHTNFRLVTVQDGISRVQHELACMPAAHVTISTDVELKRDGLPYSNRRAPLDTGVAVWFQYDGWPYVLACDCWLTIGENLAAVAAHINALRGQERWGVGTVRQAFEGHKALPARKSWWEVLECDPHATPEEVDRAYRCVAARCHPDKPGGSVSLFHTITEAHDEALRATGGRNG